MTRRVEYEARTAAGAPIKIFGDRPLAEAWWRDHAHRFPGATVVEITPSERTILRAPAQLRRVAGRPWEALQGALDAAEAATGAWEGGAD